jgi:hypothetical protein
MKYISIRLGWPNEHLFNSEIPFYLYEDKAFEGILKGVLSYSFFLYMYMYWFIKCAVFVVGS